jgi:hypothetical protein
MGKGEEMKKRLDMIRVRLTDLPDGERAKWEKWLGAARAATP